MNIKCKKCGTINDVNIGSLIRSVNTKQQQKASKLNGKLGGRPKGSKDKHPRKPTKRK